MEEFTRITNSNRLKWIIDRYISILRKQKLYSPSQHFLLLAQMGETSAFTGRIPVSIQVLQHFGFSRSNSQSGWQFSRHSPYHDRLLLLRSHFGLSYVDSRIIGKFLPDLRKQFLLTIVI